MMTDINPAITALSAYATGTTIELSASGTSEIDGSSLVDCSRGDAHGLESLEPGTVDAILALDLFDVVQDRVKVLFLIRQALVEGGTLAFSVGKHLPPTAINSLFKVVGGFTMDVSTLGEGSLVVARRSVLLDVRQPFGLQSAFLAAAAQHNDVVRSELYFQIGNVLLRSGDPKLAEQCFTSVIELEPRGSEGHFGLGMCYASQGLWSDAVTVLQQALALDPTNTDAAQWAELARESYAAQGDVEEIAETIAETAAETVAEAIAEIPAAAAAPVAVPGSAPTSGTHKKLSAITDEIGAMTETLAKLAQLTR